MNLPEYMKQYGEPKTLPSYTYRMDPKTKRIAGHADDLEALAQSIYLYLSIERYDWEIFPDDYGIEMRDLFGRDPREVQILLESRVKDCLSVDTRIKDIIDYDSVINKSDIIVRFTVVSIYGDVEIVKELTIGEGNV